MFERLTIKTKIVAAYTLVFGLLLTGFAILTYNNVRNGGIAELDSQLAIYAGRLAEDVAQDIEDNETTDPEDIRGFAPDGLSNSYVQIWKRDGELYFSDSLLSSLSIAVPTEIEDEPQVESAHISGSHLRIYYQPIEIDEHFPYIVQVAVSLQDVEKKLGLLRWLFWNLIPLTLFLCGLAAFALTRAAFKPILQMTDTARNITMNRLDARVAVPLAKDEVRGLAETLNELLSRIEAAFESQRQFVADASHELRTPLTVIRTELEFAAKLADQTKSQESITSAIAETVRMERLTNQLLALVRMDSGQLKLELSSVRLDDLLVECTQQLSPIAASKQVEIRLHIAEAIELQADALQLKSALMNIIENAVKYSPKGSEVLVSLVKTAQPEPAILFIIADNGPGVPIEEHELIFRRFYRAKAHRGESNGSGLGLAIAHNIVGLHKGRITLRSQSGHGSEFTIELPLS